jgi:hypothetical protein
MFIFFCFGVSDAFAQKDTIKMDTTEYELVVMDPGYESFLIMQPPKSYHTEGYYESWNRRYVSQWNNYYTSGIYPDNVQSYIDYNHQVDYDKELDYKLYYYFKYWEKSNGVKLVPGSR